MSIHKAFNEITEDLGGTPSTDGTIAGAIDALNDTLAGSDQERGNSIEDAVRLLGEHIGSGEKRQPIYVFGDTYVTGVDIIDFWDTELYQITIEDGEPSSEPGLKVGQKYMLDTISIESGREIESISITDDADGGMGSVPIGSDRGFIMPDSSSIFISIGTTQQK